MDNTESSYEKDIRSRSSLKFLKGAIPRLKNYILYSYNTWLARRNGAIIGDCVSIPYKLAKIANHNLQIGSHTSIQTIDIDIRAPVNIGSHVIIGAGVQILTCSHNIDSPEWEHKSYGITIEDYSWIATNVFILPSCRKISKGSVCAAGAVVVKNVDEMAIVSGNPAQYLKTRKDVHRDLCVESLRGNDFMAYVKAYKIRLAK